MSLPGGLEGRRQVTQTRRGRATRHRPGVRTQFTLPMELLSRYQICLRGRLLPKHIMLHWHHISITFHQVATAELKLRSHPSAVRYIRWLGRPTA